MAADRRPACETDSSRVFWYVRKRRAMAPGARHSRRSPTPCSTSSSPRAADSSRSPSWLELATCNQFQQRQLPRRRRSTLDLRTLWIHGAAYDPKWAMWVGSGEHFSFGNQIEAARRNWGTLVSSLEPAPRGRRLPPRTPRAGTSSTRRGKRRRRCGPPNSGSAGPTTC